MSDSTTSEEYPLQREQIANYYYWQSICLILLTSIWFFGLGIVLALLYAFTIGTWLPKRQADALHYWLDGTTLRIDQGVYFLKRKAIPLDRVTNLSLSQGPILRYCGLWSLNIQTAGAGGQSIPEGILVGLEDPETIRDEILKARDAARRHPDQSST